MGRNLGIEIYDGLICLLLVLDKLLNVLVLLQVIGMFLNSAIVGSASNFDMGNALVLLALVFGEFLLQDILELLLVLGCLHAQAVSEPRW